MVHTLSTGPRTGNKLKYTHLLKFFAVDRKIFALRLYLYCKRWILAMKLCETHAYVRIVFLCTPTTSHHLFFAILTASSICLTPF